MTKGCRSSFAVRRTNTGLGLFTLKSIRAGRRIIEYIGPIVTTGVVERSGGKYFFKLDEDYAIDGRARSNIARYINHSCQSSAEAFTCGRRIWVYAKRTLHVGDQITIDYGEEYLNAHMKQAGCKCQVCA